MFAKADILAGFNTIPLTPSRVIMVHSSYKSLGGVEGGAAEGQRGQRRADLVAHGQRRVILPFGV